MAAAAPEKQLKLGNINAINVTPMVDILLVLLVILMATAQYIVNNNLQVNLPQETSFEGPTPPTAKVTIAADGTLAYDGETVTQTSLMRRFQDLRAGSDAAVVVIEADRAAQHGMTVNVLDLARQSGLTRFSLRAAHLE